LSAGELIVENGWFAVSSPCASLRLAVKSGVIDYSSPFPGDNPVHNQVVKSKRHNLSAAYVDLTKF
jgi:hypothetical protein